MKKTKTEVHYSTGTPKEHCSICKHFIKNAVDVSAGRGDRCTKVAGAIGREDWCTLYIPKTSVVS